ncbi:hypothetical protein CACET_c27990 [Clostridium aceticum]|uniref:Uncharacterized protein n=1 Tax=Clostridium aceticum TaxID=84022 RepID=A0A0D8IBQ0_9CLOT|nr:hypothetical protein [Clostridium aceticum]AKL96244.1 hypothetical protein CACET_c27990 [Clostridium aceticum]KJF26651.1 hypothetical protein TZ02_12345 [Clostridium aceticum]
MKDKRVISLLAVVILVVQVVITLYINWITNIKGFGLINVVELQSIMDIFYGIHNSTVEIVFESSIVLIGAILLRYSTLLIIGWMSDRLFETEILNKLSFGYLKVEKEELKELHCKSDKLQPVTIKRLVFKSLVMCILGTTCVMIPYMDMGYWIIETFGGIAKLVSYFMETYLV